MIEAKSHIISRLRQEINAMQGFRPKDGEGGFDAGLGRIRYKFPTQSFPRGAMHEFIFGRPEDAAATCGFICGLLSSLMKHNGPVVWIGAGRKIFPPALQAFGIAADRVIFIDLYKEKEILWATEECLKCKNLAAVITETGRLSLITSRRMQLATEQSGVTGFIVHQSEKQVSATACVARWQIRSLPSLVPECMPGLGFPAWKVDLLKVRNGSPGSWELSFSGGKFHHITPVAGMQPLQHKKTG